MKWLDRMSDEAWERFENIAVAVALIWLGVSIGIVFWLKSTIGL